MLKSYKVTKLKRYAIGFVVTLLTFLTLVTFYQGISFRSRKNFPVSFCGASLASHTIVSAPSSTDRVAPCPPISVRTQPGQTEFIANFGSAVANCDVTPLSAVFEIQ